MNDAIKLARDNGYQIYNFQIGDEDLVDHKSDEEINHLQDFHAAPCAWCGRNKLIHPN